jgi:hypothetical protein
MGNASATVAVVFSGLIPGNGGRDPLLHCTLLRNTPLKLDHPLWCGTSVLPGVSLGFKSTIIASILGKFSSKMSQISSMPNNLFM